MADETTTAGESKTAPWHVSEHLHVEQAQQPERKECATDSQCVPQDSESITPEMLTLIALDQQQIDTIVQTVPGGAKNVQDIYPLSPLQEGILFHYLLNEQIDTYVLSILFQLESRAQIGVLINALQKVIDRHDILRTAVLWEKLARPAQVVYREAILPVEELTLDGERESLGQLSGWMKPVSQKRDLRKAPLVWLQVAADPHGVQWYAVLKVHHLICDHQTLRVVVAEVFSCLQGRENELPLPVAFRRYVAQALENVRTRDAEAFFRSKLGNIDEPTAPFGVFDVHGDGSQIEEAHHVLDSDLAIQVRSQARRFGVSAARLFHAAWGLVVARTSGRDDVVYGTVLLAARQRSARAQRMLGLSVNTLPLRLRLQDVTAEGLLEQTHRELGELLNLEAASLTMAQSCSGMVGRTPLFTSLLNFRHSAPDPKTDVDGAAGVRVLARGEAWTNYPVTMTVDDVGEGFVLMAKADRRIGPQRVMDYLCTALQSLSEALARAPQTPAVALSILPKAERHEVIELFNATHVRQSANELIHELFEKQAECSPDAAAVVYESQSLTYAELNGKANQLARHLRSRGVGPDQLVALCIERSVEMLVGMLGILKAGGAYMPLDPSNPVDRLEYLLTDAVPRVLLTREGLKKVLPKTTAEVITLDDDWLEIAKQGEENLDSRSMQLSPQHLAYVIYTSGTTGKPKGVMIQHRNIVNYATHALRHFGVMSGDGSLVCTSLSFDLMLTGLYPTLLCGRTVRLCREQQGLPPLADEIIKCSHLAPLKLTPSHLALLDQPLRSGQLAGRVRALVLGGEPLPASAVQMWRMYAPGTRIFNHYGPTETTVGCVIHEIDELAAGAVPLGRPISNTQIYVLDRHGQPVPVGVAGEIHVGGAGVARGYLNRPELTAERFVPDPFSADARARMYKTGDLGRWRADGTIEYLGRNDHQVKIRGFRIELGEIEAQLVRHEEVKEAAVIAREDTPGEKRLVAYVVPGNPSNPLSVEGLRTHMKAALPEYMVPSAFVTLESMPLTANGKLDRRALPAPEIEAYASGEYQPPQGEVEEILAGTWQTLLRIDRVGRQDNFFELGGHSLLIVQMMERLRSVGLSAEVRRVFENPTLAGLASVLTREAHAQFEVPPNKIPVACETITPQMLTLVELEEEHIDVVVQSVPGGAINIQDIYPLAPLQEGILFHHLFNEHRGDVYVRSIVLSVSSRERLEQLITALQAVIDRHDVLRTAVLWEQLPQPVQVVYRRATLPVEEITLAQDLDPTEQINEWLKPERQILDLRQAPLMRLQVASGPSDGRLYVLLRSHHIISDFTSQEIVTGEVVAHLNAQAERLPAPVPYRNHVAQALASARSRDAEAFFRSRLGDLEEPTAPFGLMDVHGDGSQVKESHEEIEPVLAQRLRKQARRCGVSAATLFHAAWGLVVAHTSGQDDVVFGTVLLGRLQGSAGAQRILGMFINTLPFRLKFRGMTAKELVEQTQRELVELLHFEQASLAVAHRCSNIAGSAPLFSALLNYRHNVPNPDAEWSSADGMRVLAGQARTNYPVVLSVDDLGDGFRLSAQTDSRIEPRRISSYLRTAVQSLVETLSQSPWTPALELSILPEDERRQLITLFNATQADHPQDRLIHELFEEQVRRTPDALAVAFERQSLTYVQLNEKANQLAHYLRDKGVRADQLVGICVERSLEMVVGLMGILKSGGAYVPLDPNYPVERLAYMLKDAVPRVLLIQERLRARLPETTAEAIALDSDWSEIAQRPTVDIDAGDREVRSRHLAYVIYTSGSTGQPKGVAIEHRNTVNMICWARAAMDREVFGNTLQSTSLNFDLAVYECFVPLSTGGSITLVENALALVKEPAAVTLINTVPSAIKGILDSGSVPETTRVVNLAGEVLKEELVDRIFSRSSVDRVCNLYGPSETTTYSTWVSMCRKGGFNSSIGHPVENTQVYILDRGRKLAPLGVMGEIYIGGAGVARGYLNRPELTAERFLPDPFSAEPQGRMYKTGDLGRWRADGTIEYSGRNDHQVKIRGHRIELGEIEAQLVRHDQVKEAIVIARDDDPVGKRLVAYITRRGESDPTAKGLRVHLEAVLPEYMVPSAFVILQSFPLTPNGKLDRRALPSPEFGAYAYREYEAPQGTVEKALAEIWQDLLEMKQVGRQDSFFDLGGHSLLVLNALFRINQAFDCALTVRDVYKSPTLQELAARICGSSIEDDVVDLAREAALDYRIVAKSGRRCVPAQAVMLTGATGFVGRFLLAQLLQDTDATIYCVVRAPSEHDAASRLRTTLKRWDLWCEEYEPRVVGIPGDLRQPHLGIVDRTYQMLSQNVDSIYHCATSMNHLETYAMAKRANVESARELLKLAINYKPKLINYISTLAIFSASAVGTTRVVDEMSRIEHERHSASRGYAASKWVGEKIFMTASERGIPCNIFRLGLVWADTQQGRYDELQREYRIFKSCLLSGCGIRNYRYEMAPTPVDYVARSVVFLANRHRNGQGIFHISSSLQTIEGVFERCNEIVGTSLELMSLYDWTREIRRLHRAGWSLPVVPLIEFAFSMNEKSFDEYQHGMRSARIRVDCQRTHRELEDAGIVAPGLSDDLLRRFVESMLSRDVELIDPTSSSMLRSGENLGSEDLGVR